MKLSRFLQGSAVLAAVTCVVLGARVSSAVPVQKAPLDPLTIPKYQQPLVIPPAMPKTGTRVTPDGKTADYYEIAVRQFQQQILPPGMPLTTVWSYCSVQNPQTLNYPAFTIEAQNNTPVVVKWSNELVDAQGNYLPHLLPVDQTLHWANPSGGAAGRDSHGMDPTSYTGPVPLVTHVHGAHAMPDSDGYPEAWYLPNANNIPAGYATTGSDYEINRDASPYWQEWGPGSAVFRYDNDQRASTLWYHDHTLGMTRLNVYAGPAGFYLIRGGADDTVTTMQGGPATLPNPAPGVTIPGPVYEIPIAIQDRSFYDDGSLFYPDTRAFFDGFTGPYVGDPAGQPSDIAPIWNPEVFGNTMVVNGRTWPYLDVEQRRYRLRLLNGNPSRFLILQFDNGMPFWQIGAEGGFLAQPVQLQQLLLGNAERADVIVDFTNVPVGTNIILKNIGPDSPFGGGVPGVDFPPADPNTTGQVMQFRVVSACVGQDASTPPNQLVLPARAPLGQANNVRQVSLNELDSNIIIDPLTQLPFGPRLATLGLVDLTTTPGVPMGMPMMWADGITENPILGDTEIWEIFNFTADAHPVHIHMVQFEVINREVWDSLVGVPGTITPPEPWESGTKDTVTVYPGQLTRVKAKFDLPGLFVWHCHITEHEDNEMMRPYEVIGEPVPVKGASLDADPREDLVVDFGPAYGILVLRNNTAWSQLDPISPDSMVSADLDNDALSDLVIDFGPGYGIWIYYGSGARVQLHNISPESIASADLDNDGISELIADFGPDYGVWIYSGNAAWSQLNPISPASIVSADLDNTGVPDLVIDFGPAYGIWVYYNNSTWAQLHSTSPKSMVAAPDLDNNGLPELVVDFGPAYGIWILYNNTAWSQLNPVTSDAIVSADLDNDGLSDLVVDFGPAYGIWVYYSSGTWAQLHNISPESIAAANIDGAAGSDLIADFGPRYGIWAYSNNTSWVQLHTVSP